MLKPHVRLIDGLLDFHNENKTQIFTLVYIFKVLVNSKYLHSAEKFTILIVALVFTDQKIEFID